MYNAIDTRTTLSLARQHQADLKRSFPRRWGKRSNTDHVTMSPPSRIDVGAMSIPGPREPQKESTAA